MTNKNDHLNEFELRLSRELWHVEAPATLFDSVIQKAATPLPSTRILPFPRRYPWMGKVAASLLLGGLLAGGVERHHRSEERTRAEQDFARSQQITDQVMRHTREQIQRAGVALDD